MGFDHDLLKSRIVRTYGTVTEGARELGYSAKTLYRKLSGEVAMTDTDIETFRRSRMGIRDNEIPGLFFMAKKF